MEPSELGISDSDRDPATAIALPAPTAGPLVLAFGIALIFAAMATHAILAVVGAVLAVAGGVDWFTQVLPHPVHEHVVPEVTVVTVHTDRPEVEHVAVASGLVRANLPLELYPVSAGIHGGIAGGVAMAALATLYGMLSGHGVWYPINLLAAGFFPGATDAELSSFHPNAFLIAFLIHAIASLLVGVLYGAMLPMLPRRPILLGGLIAPVLWTGLLHSTLWLINPTLAGRIDWGWFGLSQLGFGVVAGLVASRRERIPNDQPLTFAMRAGVEATGLPRAASDERGTHG
jgi:hypothetical protein